MDIGSNIKRIRENRNMTQKELADTAGISEISIRKYEANDRKPKYENLEKIAKALRVSIHELNNTNSLTFELITQLKGILNKDIYNIEKSTNIAQSSIDAIIENPHKDLPIKDFQCLLNLFFNINKTACEGFCNTHTFDGDIEQTKLLMDILNPINTNTNTNTDSTKETTNNLFDKDTFNEIIKARVLDISNQYKVNVEESEISNIIEQVDNLISFELFKMKNK